MSDEIEPLRFAHFAVLHRADGSLWELGKGGMGVTYKAFDTKLKVDVVLKLPHEHLMGSERNLRLFLREARAAAKVRHANIASVIHLNDEPPYYYAMEFVAGLPLDRLLKERRSLPLAEALDVLDQIAAALQALSGAQIVHRDLKPANLVLLPDDERPFNRTVKLIDFGLAKGFAVAGAEAATYLQNSLSQAGVFSGTVVFASPEQCAGALELDTRSDLYSAGVILWQMLTGGVPFTGSLQQILGMHQFKEPPWAALAEFPEPVVELLRRLLAKDPESRFQTPRLLREALRATSAVRTPPPNPAPTVTAAKSPALPALKALTESLTLGTTLVARFRLGEDLGGGDGGRLFRAADNATGDAPVAVKVLRSDWLRDRTFVDSLTRQLGAMRRLPNPVWLGPLGGLEHSGDSAFFVREWAQGFSLDELLRARHGELSASEVSLLLGALPAAIDRAAEEGFTFAEPILRKLFVMPVAEAGPGSDWPARRSQPLAEWPDFALRWNAFSFRPSGTAASATVTQNANDAVAVTEDAVIALALLVRQLLGGVAGTLTPIAALGGEANAVLQRALASGGGKRAFPSAQEFWSEFGRAHESTPARLGDRKSPARRSPAKVATVLSRESPTPKLAAREPKPVPAPAPALATPTPKTIPATPTPLAKPVSATPPPKIPVVPKQKPAQVSAPSGQAWPRRLLVMLAFSLLAVGGWWVWSSRAGDKSGLSSTRATQSATTVSTAATIDLPFVNEIGMRLVPVAGTSVLFSIWDTRVRDYKIFAEETRRNWEKPSFAQAEDHPAVNVSWEDAAAFCEWLTLRERASRRISGSQKYRLPRDLEWSVAVGLPRETGSTPSERDNKTLDIFPWNNGKGTWPPPRGAGNYDKFVKVDDFPYTSPVGSFSANQFGLYDMGGNVWQWCEDWHDASNQLRVSRGGAWRVGFAVYLANALSVRGYLCSAYRKIDRPGVRDGNMGFRVVLAEDR